MSQTEGFADIIPDLPSSQKRFNPFGSLVNLLNPQIDLRKETNTQVKQATNSINLTGGLGAYKQAGIIGNSQIPEGQPESLEKAQKVCEAVRADTFNKAVCNSFDNEEFAKYCGISFDLKSTNSKGEVQGIGGLYLDPSERIRQKANAVEDIAPEYIYSPTYGRTAVGTFVADKETCVAVAEETECTQKKSFGVPNCAQCLPSSEFHRIDPTIPLIPPSLVIMTNAKTLIFTTGSSGSSMLTNAKDDTNKAEKIRKMPGPTTADMIMFPDLKENNNITVMIDGEKPENPFIAGFVTGQTRKGPYTLDIKYLIEGTGGYKPRYLGTKSVTYDDNTVKCYSIYFDPLKPLALKMPFSFASIASSDSKRCDNGPFITTAASAAFLDSDPCHKDGSGPGTYSAICLDQIFKGFGGTDKGTGSPLKEEGLKAIRFGPGDKARTLEEIGDFLMEQGTKASTGLYNGVSLPRDERLAALMFMTGDSFIDPCEGGLSDECIQSLYTNPSTYDLPINMYASLNENGLPVFCTADGLLNPMRPEGLAKAKSLTTKEAVIEKYRSTLATANNNELSNEDRKNALNDCYGITLGSKIIL
uniref:Uncharacterized protein n=1 Tax=viral metagenome TaxID=1070528 RepID=A0A6C0APB8_9ZZZZ